MSGAALLPWTRKEAGHGRHSDEAGQDSDFLTQISFSSFEEERMWIRVKRGVRDGSDLSRLKDPFLLSLSLFEQGNGEQEKREREQV
jgi:hypothetical protein